MSGLYDRLARILSGGAGRRRRVPVGEKFRRFRAIGSSNDAFLHLLADLQDREEDPAAEACASADSALEEMGRHVHSMAEALVALSGGRHAEVLRRCGEIDRNLRTELHGAPPGDTGAVIVWPGDPDALRPRVVGPKAARLAEATSIPGLEVPPFFSVSARGYRLFMEGSGLGEVVDGVLSSSGSPEPGAVKAASEAIGAAFARAVVPEEIEAGLQSAVRTLLDRGRWEPGVAVRSSAVVEGSASSFAGQFESVLNVRGPDLAEAYKRVVASKYRHHALRYALSRGFREKDVAMPVLVMAMVRPSSSGVAYSRCPGRPQSVMITAVPGLAQAVVDGRVTPDTFLVSIRDPDLVEEFLPGRRGFSLRCAADGGLIEVGERVAPAGAPALPADGVREVARMACSLEKHFGSPQDVEWARNEAGRVLVVQTRPLHLPRVDARPQPSRPPVEGHRVLLAGGRRASGGVASGPLFHLRDPMHVDAVPEGAILRVPMTTPRLAGVMGLAGGIIAAAGSPVGHMSTIAREFGVPCVIGAADSLASLPQGAIVTLDADAGIVYEGAVPGPPGPGPHARPAGRSRDPAGEDLDLLLQQVSPLTLPEPGTPGFLPENCRTFHDIARYVHQAAMAEMFELEDSAAGEMRSARRLAWGVPLQVLLVDLGGGAEAGDPSVVTVAGLRSVPLLAVIEGMSDPRLHWTGPVGFDLKGFMSVVVHSAADDQRYGEPCYCLCSPDYMHFASRLAYHFATVDSICGGSVNENYARFLFHGGAAVAARREWRAHFLAVILESHGFAVRQAGDRVEAVLAKRGADRVVEALGMLGRLMVASRHLDMVIESRSTADVLARAFLSGDYSFRRLAGHGPRDGTGAAPPSASPT